MTNIMYEKYIFYKTVVPLKKNMDVLQMRSGSWLVCITSFDL